MLATRCKPRWPGAVAITVGSPFRGLTRHLGTTTTTTTTTTAHPEEGRRDVDEHGGRHDGSFRVVLMSRGASRSPYIVRAYEPEPFSYLDLITRVTSYPRSKSRQLVNRLQRELRGAAQGGSRADRDKLGAASDPPAARQPAAAVEPQSSPPLEYVLDRAIDLLDGVCEQLRPVLSAVSEDVSEGLVPEGHTHDLAALRAHHLGRWYAGGWLGLQYEHRQISRYLDAMAAQTDKARRYIASSYVWHGHEVLRAQKEAVKLEIQQYQDEFEAVAYRMVRELEAARRNGQWRRVWALERQLATTASTCLPSQPLASVWHTLSPTDEGRITEIAMSRMARWDDSYKLLYEEDVETRGRMSLVKAYQTIFNSAVYMNAKPWRGESPIYTVSSPTGTDKRFIVLRLDRRSRPSPLWPRAWKPIWRPTWRAETGTGPEPAGAQGETEGRTISTPPGPGRFRMHKIIGAHKVPKTKSKDKRSRDTRADSDIPEAWYGSLLSDDPS